MIPKISIIVPIYNAERFLRQTIESILCQPFESFELLLIDDGSKDKSSTICLSYESKDKRVRYIYKKNGGVSSARNLGISEAIGDYIYFMDSDDLLHPRFFDLVTKEFDKCDIICFGYIPFTLTPKFAPIENYAYEQYNNKPIDAFDELVNKGLAISVWSKIIRVGLLRDNNIRFSTQMSYGEDVFVSWKCCLTANSICLLNTPLYYYRQSGYGATAKYHANLYENYKKAFDDIEVFAKGLSLYNDVFKSNSNRYLAKCLTSFVYMEVSAPYGEAERIKRLKLILRDPEIQNGLRLLPQNRFITQAINSEADLILNEAYKAYRIIKIKNFFKRLLSICIEYCMYILN